MENFVTSYGIYLAYFAIVVAVLGALAFPLIQMFQNLKKARMALLGIGIVVVLFLVCWLLSGDAEFSVGDTTVAGPKMRVVEAAIFTFYSLLAVSIVAILYSSISRYFK